MRLYVKPNTTALMTAHNKLIDNNKSHVISFSYSEKYGHYAVIDLYDDVIKGIEILNSAGVEQLPKRNKC